MRFVATDSNFSAIQEGNASIQSARVLGTITEEHRTFYFLDRLIDVREDLIPDDWKLTGAISTVAIHERGIA